YWGNPDAHARLGYRAVRCAEPRRLPSELKYTLLTESVCPIREAAYSLVSASQTFTVWSQLPDTMRLPSAEKATLQTPLVCPLTVTALFRACAANPVACAGLVRPTLPLAEPRRLPSGENATLVTQSVCPLRVSVSCPEYASHTFTVWSALPE